MFSTVNVVLLFTNCLTGHLRQNRMTSVIWLLNPFYFESSNRFKQSPSDSKKVYVCGHARNTVTSFSPLKANVLFIWIQVLAGEAFR